MDDVKTRKRLGIKVPRSILLPPYLAANQFYVEYMDAIDEMFEVTDKHVDQLANIRNMWVQNPDTEEFVMDGELVPSEAWTQPQRELLVKQVNMLGMKLRNAGVVSDIAYQTIARFVGEYWFGKGTESFIEFISFCLAVDLSVKKLWTSDYITFLREGDSSIGTPIWEGGEWYPTTHVELVARGGLNNLDLETLQSFFYEISNYNLVLQATTSEFDMYVVDRLEDDHNLAQIVGAGLWSDNQLVIANFTGFGAPPPPSHYIGTIGTSYRLPTTCYTAGGAAVDFQEAFLLAKPSGWMLIDNDTKKVPVYGQGYRNVTDQPALGVELIGNALPSGQFNLLYGPVTWLGIPGSAGSRSRIPAYSTSNMIVQEVETSISSRTVGRQRTGLLTNPDGFFELSTGAFVPYWNNV